MPTIDESSIIASLVKLFFSSTAFAQCPKMYTSQGRSWHTHVIPIMQSPTREQAKYTKITLLGQLCFFKTSTCTGEIGRVQQQQDLQHALLVRNHGFHAPLDNTNAIIVKRLDNMLCRRVACCFGNVVFTAGLSKCDSCLVTNGLWFLPVGVW